MESDSTLRLILVAAEPKTGKLLSMTPHLARLMRWLLFVGLLLPAPKSAAVGSSSKIKLLIVEGVSNHDWRHRLALVREIYGKGRVFVSTYGHVWADQTDPKGMHCVAFQTIMVRALKWLAGRDPGDTTPADFPKPDAISLRP